MGQVRTVTTSIEIAAKPSTVRSVFLNWSSYPSWTQRWTLTPLTPPDRAPPSLQTNDKIKVDLKGTVFRPTIVENTPTTFSWQGSLYGLFDGKHSFIFEESKVTPGGTTFVNKEEFTGLLTWFVREGSGGAEKAKVGFEAFNEDVKREAERVERGEGEGAGVGDGK
ncbi:hypothetical protein DM02DRAFT_668007 [Periconia macrospinosa]|uniref:Activator of Hsp90 ATPase N-terminal domain-containing protein n=1 Tax=Periconia macrospinosa TaxID=97972 RepID=A0A2V1E9X1_9PLEO|nr:hypothetical protein DM02DRAFT_668007 [Periconia macrospinosa]